MSAREWQPGDVAAITFDNASRFRRDQGHSNVVTRIAVRGDGGWGMGLNSGLSFDQVRDLGAEVRPLVVIDIADLLDDDVAEGDVARWLREAARADGRRGVMGGLNLIARQIEEQSRPPRPKEPRGLGAVVEDVDGFRWIRQGDDRLGSPWYRRNSPGTPQHRAWHEVAAVHVLSDGVES